MYGHTWGFDRTASVEGTLANFNFNRVLRVHAVDLLKIYAIIRSLICLLGV